MKHTIPGTRYGRLTVLARAESRRLPCGGLRTQWLCRCDCGVEKVIDQGNLRTGTSQSCGCWQRELAAARARTRTLKHGMWKSAEFKVWGSMLDRCTNPNHQAFHNYGGRGVTVCELWRRSFGAFYADLGPRPSPTHEIDRINNDGNYEPGNVRWATKKQQARNRRGNRLLMFNGETLCMVEWAERLGLSLQTLAMRLKNGWPLERALTEPLNQSKRH